MCAFLKYFPEFNIENVIDYYNRNKKRKGKAKKGISMFISLSNSYNTLLFKNQMERVITFKDMTKRSCNFFN